MTYKQVCRDVYPCEVLPGSLAPDGEDGNVTCVHTGLWKTELQCSITNPNPSRESAITSQRERKKGMVEGNYIVAREMTYIFM